ncbi:MAG: DUF6502 family protein [Myxococcota bacterium]
MSPDPQTPPGSTPPPALLNAIHRVLGPLVRLLLRHQVTFPALAELLKRVYVEEATAHFALPDRPQTQSRLSLLTGIHRKDIKRIQAEAGAPERTPPSVSLGAQLVLQWTAEAAYQDSKGKPAALPRLAGDGNKPSFEGLVESVSKDIRPRAVLDEWLRLGVARLGADDQVRLVASAFVPSEGFEEKAYFFGRNMHDHAAAAAHNLEGQGRPFLERNVYYARLRPESVDELRELASEVGMEALQTVNARALVLQKRDQDESDARYRMSFGSYFYRAAMREDASLPSSAPSVSSGEGGSDHD